MTLHGHIRSRAGAIADVSSTAWQIVDTLFPPATFAGGRWGCLVSCRIGEPRWLTAQVTRGTMEVALAEVLADGSLGRVSALEWMSIRVGDPLLERTLSPRQGLQAVFCLVVDTSLPHPVFGSSWTSGRGLALVARCQTNGDPSVTPFRVSDWLAVAFNAATLGTSRFVAEAYRPGQPQACNGALSGARTFTLGSAVLPSSTGTWGVFWGLQALAYGGPAASVFEVVTVANASGGTQADIARQGVRGRPAGDGNQNQAKHALGGFRVVSPPPDAATSIGLKGVDGYTAGGSGPVGQTQVAGFCWFAVKIQDLYQLLWAQENGGGSNTILAANADDVAVAWLYEPQFVFPANYVVLVSTCLQPIVPAATARAYLPHVFGSNRTPILERDLLAPQWGSTDELAPIVFGGQYGAGVGSPDEARLEIALLSGTRGIPSYPDARARGSWTTILTFGLDDDPSNYDLPAVIPGPTTRLVPGREALDPGDLDPIPREPTAQLQESVDLAQDELVGETGHRWARPRFTRAGRVVQLTWTGQTRAEALALYEFLRARRHVAWAPRSEVARAWAITGRPQLSTQGDFLVVSCTLTELLWTGP